MLSVQFGAVHMPARVGAVFLYSDQFARLNAQEVGDPKTQAQGHGHDVLFPAFQLLDRSNVHADAVGKCGLRQAPFTAQARDLRRVFRASRFHSDRPFFCGGVFILRLLGRNVKGENKKRPTGFSRGSVFVFGVQKGFDRDLKDDREAAKFIVCHQTRA